MIRTRKKTGYNPAMPPTSKQIGFCSCITILALFVAASALLRLFVDRETAANIEAGVILGVIAVVGLVAGVTRRR